METTKSKEGVEKPTAFPITAGIRNALKSAPRARRSLRPSEWDSILAGARLLLRPGFRDVGAGMIRPIWRRACGIQRCLIASAIHQIRGTGRESAWDSATRDSSVLASA